MEKAIKNLAGLGKRLSASEDLKEEIKNAVGKNPWFIGIGNLRPFHLRLQKVDAHHQAHQKKQLQLTGLQKSIGCE